jgi:hypothetical protein
MVRTHTLVEYRLKEFELEQALRSLKQQQEGLDYKLDVEFYHKLEDLTERHGYSMTQVFDLLMSRYEGSTEQVSGSSTGLRARTNTALLEMIQRLEPRHGATSEDLDNPPTKPITARATKSKSNAPLRSKSDHRTIEEGRPHSRQSRNADPDLSLLPAADHESKVGEKSHD